MREESAASGVGEGRPVGCGALAAALAAGIGVALVLTGVGRLFTSSLTVASLLVEVGFLSGVILYLAASGRPVGKTLRLSRVPTAANTEALKLGFALLFANFSATVMLGPPVRDMEFVAEAQGGAERVALVLSVALVAPVVEEALFRGLLQGVLERRLRRWFAIAVAGLGFAILHGPDAALFFFFWSLPVGWITWRAESIRPAVVVHALNNLVGVLGLLAAGGAAEAEPLERDPETLAFAAVVLAASGLWTVRACRKVGEALARGDSEREEGGGVEGAGPETGAGGRS